MESKRSLEGDPGHPAQVTLLIEPVWNRNLRHRNGEGELKLLIEPVWNRNMYWLMNGETASPLLIEPVWNRNLNITSVADIIRATFNRTSMESKRSV